MRLILLILGFGLLFTVEILRVYYIMPFPGSQEEETIDLAYWISNNIGYFRLIGLAMVVYPFFYFFNRARTVIKVILCIVFGFYAVVFYMFNSLLLADKMFLQPKTIVYNSAATNKVLPKQLVLGVTIQNESKAYPIEIIGYHHQIRDKVGGQEIMVTYCTVCRTGRVFKPTVDGELEKFRLVGMDHFNAMFEDSKTKSWWRQANGEAIAGPLKGKMLDEIPSEQMSLAQWISNHPDTRILQPDTVFSEAYKGLADYDEGKQKGNLEKKDSLSWQKKSWIVGIQIGMNARAYDWIELEKIRVANDVINGIPVLVTISPDSTSFQSFIRIVELDTLAFSASNNGKNLMDSKTSSTWAWNGHCISGSLQGETLKSIQSYQEYWHSWQTFHPQTTQYISK